MKALSKNDVKVLGVLVDYGCEVIINEAFEGEVELGFCTPELSSLFSVVEDDHFLSEVIVSDLKIMAPPAGTPNSEMSDECKGLIQLLFEVEKAIV
jgi:hypothetical protein